MLGVFSKIMREITLNFGSLFLCNQGFYKNNGKTKKWSFYLSNSRFFTFSLKFEVRIRVVTEVGWSGGYAGHCRSACISSYH
jgi:hypothetical protein